jgi:rhodanese-related sulfurtransferase
MTRIERVIYNFALKPKAVPVKFFYDNIILIIAAFTSGLLLLWPFVQKRSAGPALNAHGATRLINDSNAIVLDVRDAKEFEKGHVPNARHVPLEDVEKRAAEFKGKNPIIVMCASGPRAGKAAGTLRAQGCESVFVLDSGVVGWKEAGLPLVK